VAGPTSHTVILSVKAVPCDLNRQGDSQRAVVAADIARSATEESAKDAGALPLLSYLLDDMWTEMVERGDGKGA
jgi:hypothetical protein